MKQVTVPAAPIMIKGIKADWHRLRNEAKRSRCPFDAGFDVYPDSNEPVIERYPTGVLFKVGTSVNFCFPIGTFGYLCERSSSNEKLAGARIRPGVFDAGYTGECLITVICQPDGWEVVLAAIKKAQSEQLALAQMIVMMTYMPAFTEWNDSLVPPGRGSNGFGHSDGFVVKG